MELDLKRFQADMPYPTIGKVRQDKKLAEALKTGYCGVASELTTVLQYAYHSLKCSVRNREISETIRSIFYVETLHLEFLGNCIQKLGGDVHYNLMLSGKQLAWQSAFVNYEETVPSMLLADIEGEKGAIEFYETMGAAVSQPDIAALLLRLAEDEKLHLRIFNELHRRYA